LEAINATSDEKLVEELRRHFVVSLVALIQANARRTIAEIVDGKEKRAEELPELQDVKITLAMVRELGNREFSLGDLIAHFSSLGGFEQASSALKRVSGEDLNTILLNWFRELGDENPEESLADTRAHLMKLFYYRNIYCHEDGVGISVNHDELHDFLSATYDVNEGLSLLSEKSIKR